MSKEICINCPEGIYPDDVFCPACGEKQFDSEIKQESKKKPTLVSPTPGSRMSQKISIVQEPPISMTGYILKGKTQRQTRRGRPEDLPDLTLKKESSNDYSYRILDIIYKTLLFITFVIFVRFLIVSL